MDSRVAEIVRRHMQEQIDGYCFDEAEVSLRFTDWNLVPYGQFQLH